MTFTQLSHWLSSVANGTERVGNKKVSTASNPNMKHREIKSSFNLSTLFSSHSNKIRSESPERFDLNVSAAANSRKSLVFIQFKRATP